MSQLPLLHVQGLTKAYGTGQPVLKGVDITVQPGEFIGVIGLSGAGKSTFLRCLNRLVDPTSGQIEVLPALLGRDQAGMVDVVALKTGELRLLRRRVGMIFQQFNIVKRLSVIDNVLSGALGYQGWQSVFRWFPEAARQKALENLERVGLLEYAYQRADTLSGGQQQRVAIARTLMQEPLLILADEPVASLDPKLARQVLDILKRVCREDGITVLVSLHTLELARAYADRVVGFQGGKIFFDGPASALTDEVVDKVYATGVLTHGKSIESR